jgi:ubiquinone/menaquinone biosynthesis C-methylase UbiE
MVLGRGLPPRLPIIEDIEARRKTERARLPSRRMDRRRFWRSYLLGRDGSLGIELMTNAEAYRKMMAEQVDALSLEPGARVADLGSGTGSFLVELSDRDLRTIRVFEFEYVREALLRARLRRVSRLNSDEPAASYVACDLGGAKGLGFPCRDAVFDSILASLFISYVDDPVLVLREIRRVIKPRGTLVVSGLRRDADVSKLFTEALEEMARGEGASLLEEGAALDLPQLSRDFLNDATRLLDLEEQGVFAFRDEGELEGLLRAAGFSISRTWRCFGDPPQAVAVAARRED